MQRPIITAFLLGICAGALAVIGVLHLRAAPSRNTAAQRTSPEYLADHPEILEQVRDVLLNRRQAAEGGQRLELMHGKWQFISHVAFTPTLGDLDAPRVLMEFTDYTCGPCRASAASVRETVENRKDVRVSVLLYPIGGALSEYAARVAVAAYRQDPEKFAAFHRRLMEAGGELDQDRIIAAVRELKFDEDQIDRDERSDETRRYLQQVRRFAEDLEISGVPAFLCDERLVLGGVDAHQLKSLLGEGASVAAGAAIERASAPPLPKEGDAT